MNHHSGTWAQRAQNWPCGGYAELAPKVKLQGTGEAVIMRSHEACCFSMMRTKVHDALVAMGFPHVDFIMSRCAPTSLPSVRHRWPSGLNLVGQGKVTGRF